MKRKCNVCGRSYQAQRPTSKFCSSTCRVRNHQNPGVYSQDTANIKVQPRRVSSVDTVEPPDSGPNAPSNSLEQATRTELEAAGVLDTLMGQQALRIAQQMSGFETAGGMASLSKELSRVMNEALRAATVVDDPVDELAARRDAKRAAG